MGRMCSDCAAGALHGGTPAGSSTLVHGLPTYVAQPQGVPHGIVVIITDAFGWELINNRILADAYARKGGFKVLMPDFFDGHWMAHDMMDSVNNLMAPDKSILFERAPAAFRLVAGFLPFLFFNRFAVSGPRLVKWFQDLRVANPDSKIGAAGFCWGGKWTTYLASPAWTDDSPIKQYWPGKAPTAGEFLIDAAYAAHPSMLTMPVDMQRVQLPYSVAHASDDHGIHGQAAQQMIDILGEKDKCECVVYEGAKHGFAVRGDPSDEKVKRQGVEAEDQAVRWFKRHLAA